jgi:septum formation protein
VASKDMVVSKPANLDQAREYLRLLSGKNHSVYCGVAVASKDKILMSVARSDVVMKDYDDKIINEYIKKFHVLDKGGAYAIQFELPGYGSLVKSFKGGITTIIGLPLDHLENLLKEFGIKVKSDWPRRCKIETGYEY